MPVPDDLQTREEIGYVGLKNQGATCYMNSLLQILFHIPYFRKAVYRMPTSDNDVPSQSIPLALQNLFYKLQCSDSSVATTELTKSFGWDTYQSFQQHDAQELNRVLCEKLEEKMKGTVVEGTIPELFEGHYRNYIECVDVDYRTTKKESFYDLQLHVNGCRDVYNSFENYVQTEILKYHAGPYGFQDAKRTALFVDFPPVLQLQLMRFEFDLTQGTMGKNNDRFEFPLQLDLDQNDRKYLSPDADRSVRNLYTLHSVLVHSGGVDGGRYYAFIRPTLSDMWYKFDDEKVTKEDLKRALEEQYGGEEELELNGLKVKIPKSSNAYMLVYICESDTDKVICNVDENDIAGQLRSQLDQRKKEIAEAHLYAIIKVVRDEDIQEQIGKHIYIDLVDHDRVRSFHVTKQMYFKLFKDDVAKEFGILVQLMRFWLWKKRSIRSHRPSRPLTPTEETQSVGELSDNLGEPNEVKAELKFFLEVALEKRLPYWAKNEDILVFFKLYDPEKEELRYVGRLFVKAFHKPPTIFRTLKKMAGFAPEEKIFLFEEIPVVPKIVLQDVYSRMSFELNQLEDGDIICFQKAPLDGPFRFPHIMSFLEDVENGNRQVVHFRPLEGPKENDFSLGMSRSHTYDDVVEKVAQKLGVDDPSKIRLTPHNCYYYKPEHQAIKYRGVGHLNDMIATSDILYYEVLDIPLPELERLKTLKITFNHDIKDKAVDHTIRLAKESTIADVIEDLKKKLSRPEAKLKLFGVISHKIYKMFQSDDKIEDIDDPYLRAQELDEEKPLAPSKEQIICFYHFTYDTERQIVYFGEPFLLVSHDGETLADIKVRIHKRLQVPHDEFAKWRFAIVTWTRVEYIEDTDVIANHFQSIDSWRLGIGMEHSHKAPKRAYVQDPFTSDVSLKFYN